MVDKFDEKPTVYQMLRKVKLMKDAEMVEVFICPDGTVEERISWQKLVTELKDKRSADPNKHSIIRKGEVVCLSEISECVDNVKIDVICLIRLTLIFHFSVTARFLFVTV